MLVSFLSLPSERSVTDQLGPVIKPGARPGVAPVTSGTPRRQLSESNRSSFALNRDTSCIKHHVERNFPRTAELHKYMIKEGRSLSSSWEQIRARSSLHRERELLSFFQPSVGRGGCWQRQFPPSDGDDDDDRCYRSRLAPMIVSDFFRCEGQQGSTV